MDRLAFSREVAALNLGKRLPDGVYAHVEALPYLPAELRAAVDEARTLARLDRDAFQIVKFGLRGWKLSLLAYPGFFDEAFPILTASWAIDLGARAVTARVYAPDGNPPILHRKETLLPPDHPRVSAFAELTGAYALARKVLSVAALGCRRRRSMRGCQSCGARGGRRIPSLSSGIVT